MSLAKLLNLSMNLFPQISDENNVIILSDWLLKTVNEDTGSNFIPELQVLQTEASVRNLRLMGKTEISKIEMGLKGAIKLWRAWDRRGN